LIAKIAFAPNPAGGRGLAALPQKPLRILRAGRESTGEVKGRERKRDGEVGATWGRLLPGPERGRDAPGSRFTMRSDLVVKLPRHRPNGYIVHGYGRHRTSDIAPEPLQAPAVDQ